MALAALKNDKKKYTFADYLTWGEDERVELIDGEVFAMAPSPSLSHEMSSGSIFAQLYVYLRGKRCKVFDAPFDVRLFEREGDTPEKVDTVVQPDIFVVCDPDKLDQRGCKGAPDLVVEILSPSSRRHDRIRKLNLYQRAGVREYWIVDPVSKDVQVFLHDGNSLLLVEDYGQEDMAKVNVLEDCFIDLREVFAE